MIAPIATQDRSPPLPIFRRTIVGPGMYFESPVAFRAPIAKNLMRPPALEVAATPHAHAPHMREFQRTIDPAAAAPLRRANVPIGMIVERNNNERLRDAADPERAQVVKVTGAVKQKRRETRLKFAVELVDQARRRREAKLRPPLTRFNNRQAKRFVPPRVIQVEMQSAADQANLLRGVERAKTLTCCMSESCKCPLNRKENQSRFHWQIDGATWSILCTHFPTAVRT